MTPVPELVEPAMAQVEAVKQALSPWAAQQMYLNFAETHSAAPLWSYPCRLPQSHCPVRAPSRNQSTAWTRIRRS